MVVYYPPGRDMTPILYYEAPVDEKTMELRRQYKVDENGYPEHYKWRSLAKLPKEFTPRQLYECLPEYDPRVDRTFSRVHAGIISVIGGLALQFYCCYHATLPPWRKPYIAPLVIAVSYSSFLYYEQFALSRAALRNKSIEEYYEQHPDRFQPFKRYKLRETLLPWVPHR